MTWEGTFELAMAIQTWVYHCTIYGVEEKLKIYEFHNFPAIAKVYLKPPVHPGA